MKDANSPYGEVAHRPIWLLYLSLMLRTAHQLGAAVVLAFFLLGNGEELANVYLILAAGSGIMLLLAEAARHRQLYREVSGLVTLLKCLLLAVAFHGGLPGLIAVPLAFVMASLGAHAPKSFRHRLLF